MLSWDSGESILVDGTLEHAMEVIRQFDDANANARQAGKRNLAGRLKKLSLLRAWMRSGMRSCGSTPVRVDRANARGVNLVVMAVGWFSWHAEPVMKALGKGFGKDSFRVKGLIEAADGNVIKAAIDAGMTVVVGEGEASFEIGAEHVTFTEETARRRILGTDARRNRGPATSCGYGTGGRGYAGKLSDGYRKHGSRLRS